MALTSLARQSGNHITIGDPPSKLAGASGSVVVEPTGYWAAVDALCRQTGNHVRPNFDMQVAGLIVDSGAPGRYPTAYSGPLRLQITSARRSFSEDLDYEAAKSDVKHTFQLNLQMMWEDRIRLVAYTAQPELLEAKTQDGRVLAASEPSNTSWNVATATTRQVSTSLRLLPPAIGSKTLDTLRLKWGLVVVGDFVTSEFSPVEAHRQYQQDDLLVNIESVESSSPGAASCV